MATIITSSTSARSFQSLRLIARTAPWVLTRALSTLLNNPHIYIHEQKPSPSEPKQYLLSYLSTTPPTASLAIGTTTDVPPTPESMTENPHFMDLIHTVLREHAAQDPEVQAQAQVFASQAGSMLGSGGVFFSQPDRRSWNKLGQRSDGAGGASAQGGMGSGGRAGYIHVSDSRNPPDYGRVAWSEDIFGSLEVDPHGAFVDGDGRYQPAGTYRVVTREGTLGLSPFLREKVVKRLQELDQQARENG